MRRIAVLIVACALSGCHHPISIVANGRVVTEGKIETVTPPVDQSCKLMAVPIDDCPLMHGSPRIALIDVDGLLLNMNFTGAYSLGENPIALFREKLDAAAADPAVRAVVVRINSPGGSVTATDTMWRDLHNFREGTKLPVVACLMDYGTGGAYYLASAADVIVAQPTTVTGGIGVILNLYNLRDLMAQYNIIPQEVKAGEHIDMGTSARHLPEGVREMFQAMADEFHQRFIHIVKEARPQCDKSPATFDGRVFTANEAAKRGLVDHIGYLDDALQLARRLAQQDAAQTVLYRRCNNLVHSRYAIPPNVPLHSDILPNFPGLDRKRLPAFLYMWQPEITLEKMAGN